MRLPIPLVLAGLALRELLRALGFPLHALLYLVRHRTWNERCRVDITASPAQQQVRQEQALDRFLALRTRHPSADHPAHVFLSAGEVSGEMHAVRVIAAVRAAVGGNGGRDTGRWSCFGGTLMQAEGGDLLFPLSGHAIMGLAGVLRSLPFVLRALARYLRLLRDDPPDLVVLVDYPGLHVIMGRLARRHGIPVLHYIAPQYWAWAPWRLRRYRGCVDATLTILPFEPGFYDRLDLPSAYVGHPLLDHLAAHPPDPDAVAAVRARATVCLLPGSRRVEIELILPAYVTIARRLRRDSPDLRFVLPHIDPRRTELIRDTLARHDAADLIEFHPGPLAAWLQGARVVLAKSGTGSLEACLHGAPTVVVYRMRGPVWAWLARNFLTAPWFGVANLIAGREVVPEFALFDEAGWSAVETSVRSLLADGPAREECLAGLAEVQARLGEPGASARVARWIAPWLA